MKLRILIMILKLLLVVFLILSFPKYLSAQFFVKSYDFPLLSGKTDIGKSIQLDISPLESWSIAGFSNSTMASGGYDWMFLRLDKNGFVKCSALLGFPYNDSCFSHVQLETQNYVLAGFYTNQLLKQRASFSMLDTNCNHLVSKQITDTSGSTYTQVIRGSQSMGFTLTGIKESAITSIAQKKIIACQYTNLAVLMWGFTYMTIPPVSSEEAYSICYQMTDNTYAITGRTNIFTVSNTQYDVFVMKINANGGPIWMKVYRFMLTGTNSEARKIIPMLDGGFVVIGWTTANDAGFSNIWIIRISNAGNSVWSYALGNAGKIDRGHSIILSSDNTLVFTGYTDMLGTGDVILGKFPLFPMPPVIPLWVKTFERISTNDFGYDVKESLIPPGYSVTGQTNPSISGSLDAFLMKSNMNGYITPNCVDSVSLTTAPISVYVDSVNFMDIPFSDEPIIPVISHPIPVIRNLCIITKIDENGLTKPDKYSLMQNYPNPFNSFTNIQFSIPYSNNVSLKLYDITGREIYTFINEYKKSGTYIISFNADELPSGLYFYAIKSNKYKNVKRMILIK